MGGGEKKERRGEEGRAAKTQLGKVEGDWARNRERGGGGRGEYITCGRVTRETEAGERDENREYLAVD